MKSRQNILIAVGIFIALAAGIFFFIQSEKAEAYVVLETSAPKAESAQNKLYTGTIYHVFFHSLVIYPELAFKNDKKGATYRDFMVTRDEFSQTLAALYRNGFILIDISSVYSVDPLGKVSKTPLYIPEGKKPLIISLDDLNYYSFMKGRGFADKLVLDPQGNVATEVVSPDGTVHVTRDGDVVPMLDDFVESHPDFSIGGAKGVIALTGFQGVLGYRTQSGAATRSSEAVSAKLVIDRLRSTGWKFASHSYSHDHLFQTGAISLDALKSDTEKWKSEVEPLVGRTDIYIGPCGQIFAPDSPRSRFLVSQGFKMLGGVGLDLYLQYFPDHVAMDRVDIDGYRLTHDLSKLDAYLKGSNFAHTQSFR